MKKNRNASPRRNASKLAQTATTSSTILTKDAIMEIQLDATEESLGYFFPPLDAQYSKWLDNFVTNVSDNAVYLGISQAELMNLLLDQQALHFSENTAIKLKKAYTLYIANRNTLVLGDPQNSTLGLVPFPPLPTFDKMPEPATANMRARHTKLVGMLRSNPKMTSNLAALLGINPAPRKKIDPARYKPVLSLSLTPTGLPQLKTPLHNFKGFEVWCSKEKENGFEFVDNSVSNEYEDTKTKWAGTRYYMVRMLQANGKATGEFSVPIKVVVA